MLAPRADGIGVECRNVEPERCRGMSESELPPSASEAARVVVSCVGRCTRRGGELRLDTVSGNTTTLVANGGYGEFEQTCE